MNIQKINYTEPFQSLYAIATITKQLSTTANYIKDPQKTQL